MRIMGKKLLLSGLRFRVLRLQLFQIKGSSGSPYCFLEAVDSGIWL